MGVSNGGGGAPPKFLVAQAAAGAPATGTWTAGSAIIDANGLVWVCTVSGTPGTWVEGAAGGGSAPVQKIGILTAGVTNAINGETVALASSAIPANTLLVGSVLRVSGYGVVAVGGNTAKNVAFRVGPNGTTADTLIAGPVGWINNNFTFEFEGFVTIRTTGNGGTMEGAMMFNGNGGNPTLSESSAAINTTVANFLDVTFNNTTTGGGITIVACMIELLV